MHMLDYVRTRGVMRHESTIMVKTEKSKERPKRLMEMRGCKGEWNQAFLRYTGKVRP